MKATACIGWFVVASVFAKAQDFPRKELNLQNLVDEILAVQDEDLNYAELYENMLQLLSNPIDLNLITKEQLQAFFFLSEVQVQAVLAYREKAGPLLSVYELQNVPGLTRDVFLKLVPFVTVEDPTGSFNQSLLKRIAKEKNNYLLMRYDRTIEEKRGYKETTPPGSQYIGSPDKIYVRFRTSRPGDFSVGFTTEKDAGEKIRWSPSQKQYGADFFSLHAQVLNKGKVKNLIVGDYQAQFGQGLVLGSAFGIGKSAEAVTTIRRANLGFMPYTSLYEAGSFRGAAISYSLNNTITFHAMASARWRDGNIDTDSLLDSNRISSLGNSGLHRTPAELENRNTTLEKNFAGIVNYSHKSFDAGIVLHHTGFDIPVVKSPTVYNQFYFQGNRNTNAGIFLNYTYQNFTFFSEAAQTFNQGRAISAGIIGSLTSSLDVSVHVRDFSRDYQSFYSNALAESSSTQNERGVYWGWKYTVNKKYSFSGYLDLFRFPWLRYRSYAPSAGHEWLLRANYRPSRSVTLFVQMTEESKARNLSTEDNLYLTAQGARRNYWINLDYSITPKITLRTRAQFNTYDLGGHVTRGMVILQDVTLNHRRLSITGRYALVDANSYNNRLYVYENDVWLAFSFPPYSGVGVRNYVMVQYAVSKKTDIWLRWSHKRYTDRDTIGSGGETIVGNTQNDIRFQARIRL